MSAITMSPACSSAGGSTSGIFGAPSVTVIVASMQSPISSWRVGRHARRQVDRDDRQARRVHVGDDRLEHALAAASSARCRRSRRRSASHSEISEKCSSHAWLSAISTTVRPSRPRISRLVRASPRTSATLAEQEHGDVDAALDQRARDDEAVAAVVAAAAQHGDAAARRRSSKVASIAATTWRPAFSISTIDGNADLVDRAAIGFAHLRAVEDAHEEGPHPVSDRASGAAADGGATRPRRDARGSRRPGSAPL